MHHTPPAGSGRRILLSLLLMFAIQPRIRRRRTRPRALRHSACLSHRAPLRLAVRSD
jgi:hypothetical protein